MSASLLSFIANGQQQTALARNFALTSFTNVHDILPGQLSLPSSVVGK